MVGSTTTFKLCERRATTIVFYDVDEQDVTEGMEKARMFIKAIEDLIKEH